MVLVVPSTHTDRVQHTRGAATCAVCGSLWFLLAFVIAVLERSVWIGMRDAFVGVVLLVSWLMAVSRPPTAYLGDW